MSDLALDAVLGAVRLERERQDEKWGDQSHNSLPLWMTILGEEYGEACQAVLEGPYSDDREVAVARLRHELISVAAVAVACVEHLDDGVVRWRDQGDADEQ